MLLAVTNAEVEFGGMGRVEARLLCHPGRAVVALVTILPHRASVAWSWDAPGESPRRIAGGMTAASLTLLSLLGVSFLSYNSAAQSSLGENPVLWTSNNGANGIVPSLEASSLETQLGVWLHQPFVISVLS